MPATPRSRRASAPTNNPLHEARMYAAMHVAVHDALNAIERRSRPYAFATLQPLPEASPDAAVAAAARGVLVPLLEQLPAPFSDCAPASVAGVEADYAAALAAIPDGRAKEQGVSSGRAAAAAILAAADGRRLRTRRCSTPPTRRARDRASTASRPGFPFAFAPGWGDVTPFVLRDSSQFRAGPPYELTSRRYAARLRRGEAPRRRRHHHAQRRAPRNRPRSLGSGSRAPRC